MKVYISPRIDSEGHNGIHRVVLGQQKFLAQAGVEIVDRIEDADVVNSHISIMFNIPPDMPLVISNHGIHFTGELSNWGKQARVLNKDVVSALVQADVVTCPSRWIQHALRRGVLVDPLVVQHGIEVDEWQPLDYSEGYVLWNKSRVDAACNPEEMNRLAEMVGNVHFVSTFGTATRNVEIIGVQPASQMKEIIQRAGVYLDLAKESGGPCFGVLEAWASGIPVLSWNHGGNAEVIDHQKTGYLAKPGDYDDLVAGLDYCIEHRAEMGQLARREVVTKYQWKNTVLGYTQAYAQAIHRKYPVRTSVIVTAYKVDTYLPATLDSVLAQSDPNLELVVVDDASPDQSGAIVDEYAKRDPRVKVIHNQQNLHVADARNVGVMNSRGRYILPLDGDDRLTPNAVKMLADALDKDRGLQIVCGALVACHEDGRQVPSGWPPDQISYLQQIAGHNQLPYASMYRRHVWEHTGGYRRRIRTGVEDADFWTRALSFGYCGQKVTPEPTLLYTMRGDSLSHTNKGGRWLDWFPWSKVPTLTPFAATEWDTKNGWPVYSYGPIEVSVVIPVGPGHSQHIQACLDSLVAQTFTHWEAIVVNDSGEAWGDNSLFTKGFPFVRFIDSGKNHGVAWARNRGIQAAHSSRIVFLDVDDTAVPEMLEVLIKTQDTAGGWVYGDWYTCNGMGEPEKHEAPDWDANALVHKSPCPITGIYYRDHLLQVGGFDEEAPGWEDWALQIGLLKAGFCGTRVKYPIITYNMHMGERRMDNFNRRAELIQYIQMKYSDLYGKLERGENLNMGCSSCGGKSSVPVVRPVTMADGTPVANYPDGNLVMIKYVGPELQTRRIASKVERGRSYRFSANSREFPVLPGDAEWFGRRVDMQVLGPYQSKPQTMANQPIETPLVNESPAQQSLSNLDFATVIDPVEMLDIKPELKTILKEQFRSIDDLRRASDAQILSVKGIGMGRLTTIREAIQQWERQYGL